MPGPGRLGLAAPRPGPDLISGCDAARCLQRQGWGRAISRCTRRGLNARHERDALSFMPRFESPATVQRRRLRSDKSLSMPMGVGGGLVSPWWWCGGDALPGEGEQGETGGSWRWGGGRPPFPAAPAVCCAPERMPLWKEARGIASDGWNSYSAGPGPPSCSLSRVRWQSLPLLPVDGLSIPN
jgi:hypothetical protein